MNLSIPLEVVPYDPTWPHVFEAEAAKVKNALGENCLKVLHVGSTSIPGLAAKPIIDMVPVVQDILKVDHSSLEELGYTSRGELGMPFRRFFKKYEEAQKFHAHVWEEGSAEIDKHLRFRQYLIDHPEALKAYETLKIKLADDFREDRYAYTLNKDEFIRDVLTKAGFKGQLMVMALTPTEWKAIRHFRQTYFFDKVPMEDPYTWTFEHKDHVHLVFYQGPQIAGYAHIQLWPEGRAALRIIVIDEPFRKKGLGSQFLSFSEKWLKHQGYKVIQTQSSPAALTFYRQNGYVEMPFNDPDGYESDPQDIDMGKVL